MQMAKWDRYEIFNTLVADSLAVNLLLEGNKGTQTRTG